MSMNKKLKRKLKRMLDIRNIAIFICIILVIVAIFFVLKPEGLHLNIGDKVKVITANLKSSDEISEEKAKKVAVKQFKELGEKDVKEDKVKLTRIIRAGEECFYITSAQNSVEIQIKGGKITRINSEPVK